MLLQFKGIERRKTKVRRPQSNGKGDEHFHAKGRET